MSQCRSILRRALRLAAVLVVVAPLGVVAVGSAFASTAVDSFGVWTLGRLGYSQTVVVPVRSVPARSPPGLVGQRVFSYRLPPSARQGPRRWYTLDLHVEVALRADSGSGDVFVEGQTNGWNAAELELHVVRGHGGLTTYWDSNDLIDGPRQGVERGRTLVFDQRNYLTNAGVRPGLNRLGILIEEYQRARVGTVMAFPDSSIGVTPIAVPTLNLTAKTGAEVIEPGRTFTIPFRLRASGAPVKQIAVSPTIDPAMVAVSGRAVRRYAVLHGTTVGMITFKALKAGTTKIVIAAQGSANNTPSVEVGVRVDRTPPDDSLALVVAGCVVGALMLAVVGVRRRSSAAHGGRL